MEQNLPHRGFPVYRTPAPLPVGPEYVVYVTALFYLRMKRQQAPFIMAYNMDGLSYFGDIVIFYNSTVYCIQVRYRYKTRPISKNELTRGGRVFSISKLFASYCEIQHGIKMNQYPFNSDLVKKMKCTQVQVVMYTNSSVEHRSLCLPQTSFPIAESNSDPEDIFSFDSEDPEIWTLDTSPKYHEFLSNFVIFSNQGDIKNIRELLKDEVERASGMQDSEAELLTIYLCNETKKWIYEDHPNFLSETSSLWYEAMLYVLNTPIKNKLSSIKYQFDCNKVDLPLPKLGLMNIVCPGDTILRLLKIYSVLKDQDALFMEMSTVARKWDQVSSICNSPVCHVLVIDVDWQTSWETFLSLFENLNSAVILVSNKYLYNPNQFPVFSDNWKFEQLTEESQREIENRIVNLQGEEVKLCNLLPKLFLQNDLNTETLLPFFDEFPIVIGKPLLLLPPMTWKDLSFVHQIEVKDSVIYNAHSNDIFAISKFPHNRAVSNTTVKLSHPAYETYKELSNKWKGTRNVHWVEFNENHLIWKHTTGNKDIVQRYAILPSNHCRANVRGCFHKTNIPDDWKEKLICGAFSSLETIATIHKMRYPNHWVVYIPDSASTEFMNNLSQMFLESPFVVLSNTIHNALLSRVGVDLNTQHGLEDLLLSVSIYNTGSIALFVEIPYNIPKDCTDRWLKAAQNFVNQTKLFQFWISNSEGPHKLCDLEVTEDEINEWYHKLLNSSDEQQNFGGFVLEERFIQKRIILGTSESLLSQAIAVGDTKRIVELLTPIHEKNRNLAIYLASLHCRHDVESQFVNDGSPTDDLLDLATSPETAIPLFKFVSRESTLAWLSSQVSEELVKQSILSAAMNETRNTRRLFRLFGFDLTQYKLRHGLHLAIAAQDLPLVKEIIPCLEKDAEESNYYLKFYSPLHEAARCGSDVAVLLLQYGDHINKTDDVGWAPLHLAAEHGNTEGVKCLIQNGADVEAISLTGHTPLHLACEQGITDTVKLLLNEEANVESKDNFGCRPLHLAARAGHTEVMMLLLDDPKSDVNVPCNENCTPLHEAAKGGHLEAVELLFISGAEVDFPSKSKRTPLFEGAERGHGDIVHYLVLKGADIYGKDLKGRTALFCAARRGAYATVRELLESGFVAKFSDEYGRTALHVAADNVVELLIEYGADIEAQCKNGKTPFLSAAWEGRRTVLEVLMKRGVNKNARDHIGRNALFACASQGHTEAACLLLQHGFVAESRDSCGRTPLEIAAWQGHTDVIYFLLQKGAHIDCRDDLGFTALYAAASAGHLHVVRLLLSQRADINGCDKFGNTPLHAAAMNGFSDVVEYLLDMGADVNAKSSLKRTPLHVAAGGGHAHVVELLIASDADLDTDDNSGLTPLDLAAERRHEEVVRLLGGE